MATRKKSPTLTVPQPVTRRLQVYGVDPSGAKSANNQITVAVPWEPLEPGPTGRKIAVIDYDAANKCYYPPVDLDDPFLLANDGLDPSESDPRFHQQMVYAIASRTIQMFEVALGRDIHWRRADRFGGAEDHALAQDRRHPSAQAVSPRHAAGQRLLQSAGARHSVRLFHRRQDRSGPQPSRPARLHLPVAGHHRARSDARGHRRHPHLFHGAHQSRRAGVPRRLRRPVRAVLALLAARRADRRDPAHRRASLSDRTRCRCPGRRFGQEGRDSRNSPLKCGRSIR